MRKQWYALAVLFVINAMNFFDRVIGGALGEPIRREWNLSDGALGALGTAFTLLYAFVGIPIGRLSDRKPRKTILAVAVFIWSGLTSLSGLTRTYWQLFATRLGVGAGEAACAPAATSLIGDLFPPQRRARAMSIFMMGLPVGIALSYYVGSYVAAAYGWRAAFFIAGIPGVLAAIAALFIDEPPRVAPKHETGSSPWRVLFSIPTFWWLIVSGALHNFNMYALGSFLAPLIIRYHHTGLRRAGLITMIVYGLSGIPGLLAGGALADRWGMKRRDGRLLVATIATLLSAPLMLVALMQPKGALLQFVLFGSLGCMAMYVYYASVYATLQDVVAPSLRGTAMSLYFFAMYVLGASFGPLATGLVSDFFTRRAAAGRPLEPFRGEGLHNAMYLVPLLSVLLTFVLFAAARTVSKDMDRMPHR
ncbi:MAG TPA: MFS transporter [Thermoanaerobaculia bacterium]|jgi:MFS family permease|nr:MFS transporter [Thermoanaerobaculia bacterium]